MTDNEENQDEEQHRNEKPYTYHTSVMLGAGDAEDATTELNIEGVAADANPMLDWFYGRPAIYLYSPTDPECQYIFVLPTSADEEPEMLMTPDWFNEDLREELK